MGLILDSSVVIAGERRGHTVRQILEQFRSDYGETEIGLSVVTIVELIHGVQRAGTEERRQRRQAFVDELIGVTIAFEDLLITATALQLGFGIVPSNVGHFEQIPGLKVVRS